MTFVKNRQAQVRHQTGILILLEKMLANVSGLKKSHLPKTHNKLMTNVMRSWWNW